MKISIKNLEPKLSQILPLAEAYMRSYNELSRQYKTDEEMKLYTKSYFLRKLWNMAEDSESSVPVLNVNDKPVGFVRYSQVPAYYKNQQNNQTSELEKGYLDGHEFGWVRKLEFTRDVKLDDKTLIVNQIYLEPALQHHGLGTFLLSRTIPQLRQQGFESLIIEYNAHNTNAEKFYRGVGFSAFAKTQDFDHIIEKDGKTDFCISDVEIAHTTIENAIKCIKLQQSKHSKASLVGQKNVSASR